MNEHARDSRNFVDVSTVWVVEDGLQAVGERFRELGQPRFVDETNIEHVADMDASLGCESRQFQGDQLVQSNHLKPPRRWMCIGNIRRSGQGIWSHLLRSEKNVDSVASLCAFPVQEHVDAGRVPVNEPGRLHRSSGGKKISPAEQNIDSASCANGGPVNGANPFGYRIATDHGIGDTTRFERRCRSA